MAGTSAGADKGRGRGAASPAAIPLPGWKDTLWRVYAEIGNDRVTLIAAGVTYFLLLALVPALTAMVSLYGLFADPATITDHLDTLAGFVPGGGMEILEEQITRLASTQDSTLGLAFAVSLILALWSANAGVKSLFEAMNVAYDETEKRSFVLLNAVSLLFTLCMVVAALLLVGVVVVLPPLLALFNLGTGLEWLIAAASGLATLLALSLGIAALYRWGPSRSRARWRWITPGAVLTLVVTAIVSVLFSWYTANFGDYNATYGSLGALVGFMTWIWLTVTILIVGGEMNAELEHQTAHDTTTGPERRLGTRGAVMADRVAGGTDPDHDVVDRSETPRDGRRGGAGRDGRREGRLSLGKLAVALPVALAYSWARSRSERGRG